MSAKEVKEVKTGRAEGVFRRAYKLAVQKHPERVAEIHQELEAMGFTKKQIQEMAKG